MNKTELQTLRILGFADIPGLLPELKCGLCQPVDT